MEVHKKAYSDAIHVCDAIRQKVDDPAASQLVKDLMSNIDTLYTRIVNLEEMQARDMYRKFKTNDESLCGEGGSSEAQAGDAGGDAGEESPAADASAGDGSDPEETEEEIALKKAELEEYNLKEKKARRELAELVRKLGRTLSTKGLRTVEHRSEIPDWLVCPICGGELARAGEYITYVLSIIAAELILVKNVVGKYSCKRCGFSTGGLHAGDSAGRPVRQEQSGACSSDASSSQEDGAGLDKASKEDPAGAEAGAESKAEAPGTGGAPEGGAPGDGAGAEKPKPPEPEEHLRTGRRKTEPGRSPKPKPGRAPSPVRGPEGLARSLRSCRRRSGLPKPAQPSPSCSDSTAAIHARHG